MKTITCRLVILLVLAGSFFTFTGCQSTAEDSTVPWSRPAEWEGQIPGMGGF